MSILTLVLLFTSGAHATSFCHQLLTYRTSNAIQDLRKHEVPVSILTKTIAGRPRAVAVASIVPEQFAKDETLFMARASATAFDGFDFIGKVGRSSSGWINIKQAAKKYYGVPSRLAGLAVQVSKIYLEEWAFRFGAKGALDGDALGAKAREKWLIGYTLATDFQRAGMQENVYNHVFANIPMRVRYAGSIVEIAPETFQVQFQQRRLKKILRTESNELLADLANLETESSYSWKRPFGIIWSLRKNRVKARNLVVVKNLDQVFAENTEGDDGLDDPANTALIVVMPDRAERIVKTLEANGYKSEEFSPSDFIQDNALDAGRSALWGLTE